MASLAGIAKGVEQIRADCSAARVAGSTPADGRHQYFPRTLARIGSSNHSWTGGCRHHFAAAPQSSLVESKRIMEQLAVGAGRQPHAAQQPAQAAL